MAQANLWKTTELMPLLSRAESTCPRPRSTAWSPATPDRIPARTFAALCDIFDCAPTTFRAVRGDARRRTADAPRHPSDLGVRPVTRSPAGSVVTTMRARRPAPPSGSGPSRVLVAGHYALAGRWPEGPICGYCYQAAKRITGVCACGTRACCQASAMATRLQALQRGHPEHRLRPLRRRGRAVQRGPVHGLRPGRRGHRSVDRPGHRPDPPGPTPPGRRPDPR